jgi:flagellar biogenesis protein FliO
MIKIWFAGCAILTSLFLNQSGFAASITVREIKVQDQETEILLDTSIEKNTVDVDYVRDIVQFSIGNATIYPAKMIHAEKAPFSKVFAYQYSPSLVRVRFSVDSNAERFKNKIKWSVEGKRISIQFPELKSVPKANDDQSLLDKITSAMDGKTDGKTDASKSLKNTPAEKNENAVEKSSVTLTGNPKKSTKLGGAKPGPSMVRSMLAMLLVVGGLGMILVYVKRRNSIGGQAKKINGPSWLSGIFNQKATSKPLMEVVATHVLGPKQSIVVMKIKGQQFVLAVTSEQIQMITQLDSDEQEVDLLEDPKVAASLGKMFGVQQNSNIPKPIQQEVEKNDPPLPMNLSDSNFDQLLKKSTGAGAIIARNAYASNAPTALDDLPKVATIPVSSKGGTIDQIRKKLGSIQ